MCRLSNPIENLWRMSIKLNPFLPAVITLKGVVLTTLEKYIKNNTDCGVIIHAGNDARRRVLS